METEDEEILSTFVANVCKEKQVWGLMSDDGWAVCPSYDEPELEVMPFWSSEQAAQSHCVDEWQEYRPSVIELEEFVYTWLQGMGQDEVLVGIEWNEDLEGPELDPVELAEKFIEKSVMRN